MTTASQPDELSVLLNQTKDKLKAYTQARKIKVSASGKDQDSPLKADFLAAALMFACGFTEEEASLQRNFVTDLAGKKVDQLQTVAALLKLEVADNSRASLIKAILHRVKDHGAPTDRGVGDTADGDSADKQTSPSNMARKLSVGEASSLDEFYHRSHRPTAPTSSTPPVASPAKDTAPTGSTQEPSFVSTKRLDTSYSRDAQIGVRFCLDTLEAQWPKEFELEMARRARKSDPDLVLFSAISTLVGQIEDFVVWYRSEERVRRVNILSKQLRDAKDEGDIRLNDLLDKFIENKPKLERARLLLMSRYDDDSDVDDGCKDP